MVVCLLRLMYGPFVYDGAEHVIATWTIVIAVARTAAAFVVVLLALRRNGKCCAMRAVCFIVLMLKINFVWTFVPLKSYSSWYVYIESDVQKRKMLQKISVHALTMIRGTFTLHSGRL